MHKVEIFIIIVDIVFLAAFLLMSLGTAFALVYYRKEISEGKKRKARKRLELDRLQSLRAEKDSELLLV
jgi:hypothetical protein